MHPASHAVSKVPGGRGAGGWRSRRWPVAGGVSRPARVARRSVARVAVVRSRGCRAVGARCPGVAVGRVPRPPGCWVVVGRRRLRLVRPAGGLGAPVRGARWHETRTAAGDLGATGDRGGDAGPAGGEAAGRKTTGQRLFLGWRGYVPHGPRPGGQYAAAPWLTTGRDLPTPTLSRPVGWCAVVAPGRLAGARPAFGLAAVGPAPAGPSMAHTASRRVCEHRDDECRRAPRDPLPERASAADRLAEGCPPFLSTMSTFRTRFFRGLWTRFLQVEGYLSTMSTFF